MNADCWTIVTGKISTAGLGAQRIARIATTLAVAGAPMLSIRSLWDKVDALMMVARGVDELTLDEEFDSRKGDPSDRIAALATACGSEDLKASDDLVGPYCPVRRSVAYRLCKLSKVKLKRVKKRDEGLPRAERGYTFLLDVEARRGAPHHLKDVDTLYARHGLVRPVRIRRMGEAKGDVRRNITRKIGLPERAASWCKIRFCTDVETVAVKVKEVIDELGVDPVSLFSGDLSTPEWPNQCPVWMALRAKALEAGCDDALPLMFDVEDIHAAKRGDPGRVSIVPPLEVRWTDFIFQAVSLESTSHDGEANCDLLRTDDCVPPPDRYGSRVILWDGDDMYVNERCATCEHVRGRGHPLRTVIDQFAVEFSSHCLARRIALRCMNTEQDEGFSYFDESFNSDGSVSYKGGNHSHYEEFAVVDKRKVRKMRRMLAEHEADDTCDAMMAFLNKYVGREAVRVEFVRRWYN